MNFPPPTERQARTIWFAITALAVAVVVALIAAIVWGAGRILGILSPVLWPLAVAVVVAYLLDPVVDWFERRNVPRARAILLVCVAAFAAVTAVLASLVPQLVVETRDLASKVPEYSQRLKHRVEEWIQHPPEALRKFFPARPEENSATPSENDTNTISTPPPPGDLWRPKLDQKTVASVTNWLSDALPKIGHWLLDQASKVASLFGVFAGLALIPVYAFYLLLEKRGIAANWKDYLPVRDSSFKDEAVFVLTAVNDYLIAFFRGQVLVAMCDGVLYTIGFLAIGLNYAFLVGLMATVLTMIPFLGAITTCVTALLLAFVQYGDVGHPLAVLGVFAVVQALEGLVISPKIMGDRVGLHPLAIILAVMTGTTLLGGILGGLLAIPLTAALRVMMFRYVWKRREVKSESAA
jgi:predicted PurR-regulated permease PerM